MSDKPTQADRVLMSLVQAGSQGVTQGQWNQTGGIDGLGWITRLPARIGELREDGLNIVTDGERDGFAVYKLRAQEREERRVVVDAAPPANSLFSVEGCCCCSPPARPSVYFDEAA
jgi:hypothetical protein